MKVSGEGYQGCKGVRTAEARLGQIINQTNVLLTLIKMQILLLTIIEINAMHCKMFVT